MRVWLGVGGQSGWVGLPDLQRVGLIMHTRAPCPHLCRLHSPPQVPYYDYALDMILDNEPPVEIMLTDQQHEMLENAAEMLYGLIHARYIVTARGLSAMLEKFKNCDFGRCPRCVLGLGWGVQGADAAPAAAAAIAAAGRMADCMLHCEQAGCSRRVQMATLCECASYLPLTHARSCRVLCEGQPCLPLGTSDLPGQSTVKIFCPKCEDIYYPRTDYHVSAAVLVCMRLHVEPACRTLHPHPPCLAPQHRTSHKMLRRPCLLTPTSPFPPSPKRRHLTQAPARPLISCARSAPSMAPTMAPPLPTCC